LIRLALLALLGACAATGEFVCETDEQCRHGDETGFCEASGYCTFSDPSCASQRRYDDNSAASVAKACLEGVTTGRIYDRYVVNDELGNPVVRERAHPASELKPTVMLEDGTTPAVAYRELDGALSFANPAGQYYELRYERNGVGAGFQHGVPHFESATFSAGRLDRVPVTRPTTLGFTQTPTTTGGAWIATTGLWTLSAPGSGSNVSFNWQTAGVMSGALGLLEGTKLDRVYYLVFGQVLGYSTITAHSTYQITLADGMGVNQMGMLTPVTTRDLCVNVMHPAGAELARMKMVHTSATGGPSNWQLSAPPARDVGRDYALPLANTQMSTPADGMTSVRFINPFPGTRPIATMFVSATVSIAYKGNSGTNFSLETRVDQAVDPTDASCSVAAMLRSTAAVGGNLTVAGTAIDAADKPVTLPANTPNIVVTWTPRLPGSANSYIVVVHELSDDTAGGTTRDQRGSFVTFEPRVMIPAAMLQSGHTYLLQITTYMGSSNAATGDLVTVSYPFESVGSYSQTFAIN
jgi:hypothetical protein